MERALTYCTLALTFAMMMLGAVVHGTGSSLACPDWPLCYGDAFPRMEGGVLFEHSHRLLGTLIGLCVVTLNVLVLRRRGLKGHGLAIGLIAAHALLVGVGVSRSIWPLALAGLLLNVPLLVLAARAAKRADVTPVWSLAILHLVIIQGVLGGLTVVLKLPVMVSSAHLGLSMIILCLLVMLGLRLGATDAAPVVASRRPLSIAIALLYVQILLGALVKHTGASLACGVDLVACNGGAPDGGPAHLHFAHRVGAVLVTIAVIAVTIPLLKAAKRAGNGRARLFAIAAHAIVITQVVLGLTTVYTTIAVSAAALHLGVGAMLLADLVALYTSVGPAASTLSATHAESATGGLAHAT